jgi:hypothetical protein
MTTSVAQTLVRGSWPGLYLARVALDKPPDEDTSRKRRVGVDGV